MLEFTLTGMLTQVAFIERDVAVPDEFGAETAADWKLQEEGVPCRLWWWKPSKSSSKSPSSQYARAQATVNVTGGDMLLPIGTDVTEADRIARVETPEGEVLETGPFRIVALNRYEDHVELSLERP